VTETNCEIRKGGFDAAVLVFRLDVRGDGIAGYGVHAPVELELLNAARAAVVISDVVVGGQLVLLMLFVCLRAGLFSFRLMPILAKSASSCTALGTWD
jgi:hypothetical protein